MSVFPTWQFYLDIYDLGDDSGYDFSAGVHDAQTRIGMNKVRQRVADPARMEITIWDQFADGLGILRRIFAPEDAYGTNSRVGKFIYVTATYSAVTYPVFRGMIEQVMPDPVTYFVKLVVVGRWATNNAPVSIPTLMNVTTDYLIAYAMEAAGFRNKLALSYGTPYPYWTIADVAGSGDGLDFMYVAEGIGDYSGSSLTGSQLNYSFQTGKTTYPYVADQYVNAPAEQIVKDAVNAEVGYFYEDQTGAFRFHNRHDVLLKTSPSVTYTLSDIIDQHYSYGLGLRNEVRMVVTSRKIVTNSTLWTSIVTHRFAAGVSFLNIHTLGTDGRVVGVLGTPVAVNWIFTRQSNGAAVTCGVLVIPNGAGVIVQVTNDVANEKVILAVGASLLGSAMIQDAPLDIVYTEPVSAWRYGRRSEIYDLALADEPETALDIARFMVGLDAQPRGVVTYIDIQNDTAALLVQQLSRNILDLIRLQMSTISHDQQYLIAGIEHTIDMAGQKLVTRFQLQPQRAGAFWILDAAGYAELDSHTRLAY